MDCSRSGPEIGCPDANMTVFRISGGETGSGHLTMGRGHVTGMSGSPEMHNPKGGLWGEITIAYYGKPLAGSGNTVKRE